MFENIEYLFTFCSSLKFIDISSFRNINKCNNFLIGLPQNGTIVINSNIISEIKKQISPNWNIIINN